MSNISIRVELPGHHHSFLLEVPNASTIHNIKTEIAKTCPGGPRIEGQRLIYGGRLLRDDEHVRDISPVGILYQISSKHSIVDNLSQSKSPQGLLTIHLAVHPSAWTTSPPDRQLPVPNIGSAPTHQTPSPPFRNPTLNTIPLTPYLAYPNTNAPSAPFIPPTHVHPFIIYKHECAIAALTTNSSTTIPTYSPDVLETARRSAMSSLQSYGWSWPHVFDEPVPMVSQGDGVKYERVVIE
jgi:Ubiquitin family